MKHSSGWPRLAPIPLLIGLLLLIGCETVPSSVCPAPKVYTQATRTQAAAELEALPEQSAIAAMIGDYGVLRAELRACAK